MAHIDINAGDDVRLAEGSAYFGKDAPKVRGGDTVNFLAAEETFVVDTTDKDRPGPGGETDGYWALLIRKA